MRGPRSHAVRASQPLGGRGRFGDVGPITGLLTFPQQASAALLAVADVAAARYYQPQLPASLDPVVTGKLTPGRTRPADSAVC
ncbi:hypothetical protein GCM10010279_31080 [Streptomyces mutabilis]|nr:hypothetical protein GCM10010279_31080 [Streptomyces mutabilis]